MTLFKRNTTITNSKKSEFPPLILRCIVHATLQIATLCVAVHTLQQVQSLRSEVKTLKHRR